MDAQVFFSAADRGARGMNAAEQSETNRFTFAMEELVRHLQGCPQQRARFLQQLLGEQACRDLGIFVLPSGFKISVVIPVFNERQWIEELISRVDAVEIPKEIIVVDDGSTDGTREILKSMERKDLRAIYHDKNRGKGAALRTGFQH